MTTSAKYLKYWLIPSSDIYDHRILKCDSNVIQTRNHLDRKQHSTI